MERVSLADVTDDGRAMLFEGEPRTVLLSLAADERVPPHTHPDRAISLHVLSGDLELDLDDATHELAAGDVVRFDGEREVSPRAVTDAEALVVLAMR